MLAGGAGQLLQALSVLLLRSRLHLSSLANSSLVQLPLLFTEPFTSLDFSLLMSRDGFSLVDSLRMFSSFS